jgi:hypothetical protein
MHFRSSQHERTGAALRPQPVSPGISLLIAISGRCGESLVSSWMQRRIPRTRSAAFRSVDFGHPEVGPQRQGLLRTSCATYLKGS